MGRGRFFLELKRSMCYFAWVPVFFFLPEKHGGGCMITFGLGLEQDFFWNFEIACFDDDLEIFGLRTYPMLTTYLGTVILVFR